jgi:hypothetical protein
VIFPAWLFHSVNPFMSDVQRISIAFNVQIRSFEAADGEPQEDDKEVAVMAAAPQKTGARKKATSKKAAQETAVVKKATGKKTAPKKSAKNVSASEGAPKLRSSRKRAPEK